MEYLSMEYWQTARDIVAMMIGVVGILCLLKSRRGFHRIFQHQMERQMKRDATADGGRIKTRTVRKTHFVKIPAVKKPPRKKMPDLRMRKTLTGKPVRRVMPRENIGLAGIPSEKPERVNGKLRVLNGPRQRKTHHTGDTDVPKAELEFRRKFERLSQLRKTGRQTPFHGKQSGYVNI